MKTILVVEDLQQTRHLICKKLWSNGYNTLDASSAQEAYDVLSHVADEINLVLSDVNLPDTTGFDLLKKIKNNPNLEDIPVIFWTSDYDSDKVRFARESGVAQFVQKPFRDECFFTEIDRAIKIKGAMINVVA